MNEKILETNDVKKYFPIYSGWLRKRVGEIRAVDGISISINKGKTLGLVGESGSGKTTLGKVIMRIYEPSSGTVLFRGRDITTIDKEDLVSFRREAQILFQDPASALNPRRKIGDTIRTPLAVHKLGNRSQQAERVADLLRLVQLPEEYADRYPYGLSGGEKQRVNLARALAVNPTFLVLDEPTSAVDVSVQSKILGLLTDLQKKLTLTYLVISHNLVVVKSISNLICVMYYAKMMELGPPEEIFQHPAHPYTLTLLSAINVLEEDVKLPSTGEVGGIVESRIDLVHPPEGCRFYARCAFRQDVCKDVYPEWREIRENHFVSCHFAERVLAGEGTK